MPEQRGQIVCQARCPHCGQGKGRTNNWEFVEKPNMYFRCRTCGDGISIAAYIRLGYRNRVYKIRHDKKGKPFPTPAHANQELQVIRRAIDSGEFHPEDYRGRKGSALLWPNWIKDHADRMNNRLKPATLRKYRSLWKHITFDTNIREIRKGDISDLIDSLDCSPKYKADILDEIKRLLRDALDRQDIEKLPGFPKVKVPDRIIRYLTKAEQGKVLKEIAPIHRPIFQFMFKHGPRVAEACALCWDYVDMTKGLFWVARTFSNRRLADTTKGGTALAFPITTDDARLFEEAARLYRDAKTLPRGEIPVFRNWERLRNNAAPRNPLRFYTPDRLNSIFKVSVEAAGLEPIKLMNATRHSTAMRLKAERVPDDVIARVLGHKGGTQHVRKYARADIGVIKGVLDV